MPIVPGFEHDVFVSYANADDVAEPSVEIGWVSMFPDGLTRALGGMGVRIGRRPLALTAENFELQRFA